MRRDGRAHFEACRVDYLLGLYAALPAEVRATADRNYALLKGNPRHPSLHFKKAGPLWSVRVGDQYRALGKAVEEGVVWFWIGTHADYDKLIR
jgi:hypothetical protein